VLISAWLLFDSKIFSGASPFLGSDLGLFSVVLLAWNSRCPFHAEFGPGFSCEGQSRFCGTFAGFCMSALDSLHTPTAGIPFSLL